MKTKFYFLLFFICTFSIGFSQYDLAYHYPTEGSSSWTIPCGVTQITVEVIGGGGGGGFGSSGERAASGGGGGAYSQKVINVVAGAVFYTYVGYGGSGGKNGPHHGEDSWFNNVNSKPTADSYYAILAKGGTGAAGNGNAPDGYGGKASQGFGTKKTNGGDGGIANGRKSGGGGGAGHESGSGNPGGNHSGGTSVSPGGRGGDGASSRTIGAENADPGYPYGGGGGGGLASHLGVFTSNGGNGANGGIVITYLKPTGTVGEIEPAAFLNSSAGTELGCTPIPTTLSATGNNVGNGVSTLWFEETDPANPSCPDVSFVETFTKNPFQYPISGGNTVGDPSGWGWAIEFHSTTNNPYIDMSNVLVGKSINPATQRYISIRYRVKTGNADKAQVWFLKDGDTGTSSSQMQEANMISDNKWHIMNIDMHSGSNGANWSGDLTGWHFNFATQSGANVLINYMILSDTPLLEVTDPDLINPGDTLQYTIPNEKASVTIGTYRIARKLVVDGSCSTTIEKTGCRFITLSRTDKTFSPSTPTGDWDVADNWSPSTVPTIDNCVLVPSGKTVFVNSNDAMAKVLTVQSGGKLEISAGQSLSVFGAISNNSGESNFIVRDSANLIQLENLVFNSGKITVEKKVRDMNNAGPAYDYVYWSSPVLGQNLRDFSPDTPTEHNKWGFLQYNEADDYFYNTGDIFFERGKGYAIRAEDDPGSPDPLPNPYSKTYSFVGVPNNGVALFQLKKTRNGYNLVGNPYPSNINADVLFAMNTDRIYGTVYLWTNNNPEQYQHGSGYSGNNYAVYNGTGGNSATRAANSPTGGNWNMNSIPNGKISVGQGFIVEAKEDQDGEFLQFANSNLSTGDPLRVSTATDFFQKAEKDRFWLTLTSPSEIVNTTLIGYIPGAVNEYDKGFDAEFWGASDAIYSIIPETQLIIQGKEYPLDTNDIVPLGYKAFETGTYIIQVEEKEGIFAEAQNIYLVDHLLNKTVNLSAKPYKFLTRAGEYNDRFEIIYKNKNIISTAQDVYEPLLLTVTRQSEDLLIMSKGDKLSEVIVYDLLGKPVFTYKDLNTEKFRIPAAEYSKQILIVNVVTQSGNTVSQKVIPK